MHTTTILQGGSFSFPFCTCFRRRFFLRFDPHVDRRDHKRPLPKRQRKKFARPPVKFVEDVIGVIRFRLALQDQFFASSTKSPMSTSNPLSA